MDLEAHHRWWKATGRDVVNQVLHDEWNPIGLEMPADEYSSYAGTVGRLLGEGRGAVDIAAFLAEAREGMALDPDPRRDREVAEKLAALAPR